MSINIKYYLNREKIAETRTVNIDTPLVDIANSIKEYLDTTPKRMNAFELAFTYESGKTTEIFLPPEEKEFIVLVPGDLSVPEYRQFTLRNLIGNYETYEYYDIRVFFNKISCGLGSLLPNNIIQK